jgi:type III secretion protein D
MPVSTLQLRLLTGPQKGGRARLENGVYTLGTSPTADFVLRGELIAEQHAELQVADGTLLLRTLQEPVETTPIKRGEVFMLGGMLLAVDDSQAPWPDLPEQAEAVPELPSEIIASPEEIARYAERDVPLPKPPRRRYGAYGIPLFVGGVVACVPIALVLLANAGLEASAPPSAPLVDPLVPLREQLSALGQSEHMRLAMAPDGVLALGGYVADTEQRLKATRWARDLPYDARVNLFATGEMRQAADETLGRLALPLTLSLAADGAGQLTGIAPSQEASERAAMLLREDVPGLRSVENRVLTLEALAADVQGALVAAGSQSPALRFTIDGARVTSVGTLDGAGMTAWRKAKAGLAAQLGGSATLVDQVRPAAVASTRRKIDHLPILALVGGPMPFLILDDGTKVQEGGSFGAGYTLVAVGPRALTIREPNGREGLFDLP